MPKLPIGDIGPCIVIWNYSDAVAANRITIGPYLGTISLRMTDSVSDVQEEGFGDAPVDAVFAGSVVELDIPMARTKLDTLEEILGYREMGSLGTGISSKVLTLKNMAGIDMYAYAKDIVIAPVRNNVPDPDPSTWTHLYKCHPYREFELTWDRAGQRIHMVKFKVFPNQDSGYCGEYGTEGMASGSTQITGICK